MSITHLSLFLVNKKIRSLRRKISLGPGKYLLKCRLSMENSNSNTTTHVLQDNYFKPSELLLNRLWFYSSSLK